MIQLRLKPLKNEVYTVLIQTIGPLVMTALGWITTRAQNKIKAFFDDIEKREKEVRELREEIGKQKLINSALWRNIDEMKEKFKK